MKPTPPHRRQIRLAPCAILLIALLGFSHPGAAQSVFAPSPQYADAPPSLRQYQQATTQDLRPTVARPIDDEPLLQWGPVTLRPHLFSRSFYGDGIPTVFTNRASSFIQTISPGVLIGIGRYWNLDYTPTWDFYSNDEFRDTLNHALSLQGGTTYGDWTFRLSQDCLLVTLPLVQTGTQTEQENYITRLLASYAVNSEMWLDFNVDQNIISADTFSSYRQWSTLNWLNQRFAPSLDAALGVSFGYADVEQGSDMLFEGLQARTRWQATKKFNLQARAGFEVRQALAGSNPNLINPVFGGTVQYQPVEVTTLSVYFDSTVLPSYFADQVTEQYSINASLDQRLLEVLYLTLSGGYVRMDYVSTSGGTTQRQDNYYFMECRLSCRIRTRGSAAAFYRYSDNHSDATGYSLQSNQAGLELGYRF